MRDPLDGLEPPLEAPGVASSHTPRQPGDRRRRSLAQGGTGTSPRPVCPGLNCQLSRTKVTVEGTGESVNGPRGIVAPCSRPRLNQPRTWQAEESEATAQAALPGRGHRAPCQPACRRPGAKAQGFAGPLRPAGTGAAGRRRARRLPGAGVYQALADHGYLPHWIAGVSIGAINGAIIAGSPETERIVRLRAFWERISGSSPLKPLIAGDWGRGTFNELSAPTTAAAGVPAFFRPRLPPVWLQPWGSEAALSFTIPRRCARRWRRSSTSTCSTAGPCG